MLGGTMSTEEEPLHGVRWMLTLYLLVHYGTGLLMIAGAAYAVSRVIQTQRAKLPPVTPVSYTHLTLPTICSV